MIAFDTNVLLRIADPISDDCAPARNANQILRRREKLVIFPQNLYEFWAVATRSAGKPPHGSNGLGMTAARADQWLRYIFRTFLVLPDPADLPNRWHVLVRHSGITGIKSHDVRLVAAMQAHNIIHLLTFNTKDFTRFPAVTLLDPHAIS